MHTAMRTWLSLVALILSACPPGAQEILDRAEGLYGIAEEPSASCEVNPHQIEFIADPPRAIFTWNEPIEGYDGALHDRAVYDILAAGSMGPTLALQGETRTTPEGALVAWDMRVAIDGSGYCWHRADWPLLACSRTYMRCDGAEPTS